MVRRRATSCSLAATLLGLALAASPAPAAVSTFDRTVLPSGLSPTTPAIGRVDGDDRADILVSHHRQSEMSLFRNMGGSAFAPAERLPLWPTGGASAMKLGDFDGDGDEDAVTMTQEGDGTVALRNDGSGSFTHVQEIPIGRSGGPGVVGDLNGDGLDDVVATHGYVMGDVADGGIQVLLGQREGAPLKVSSYDPLTAWVVGPNLVDVNRDGNLDLIYGERFRVGPTWDGATDGVVVRLGGGRGGLGERTLYDAGEWAVTGYPSLLDTTEDGVDDLVAVHTNAGRMTTWPGRGDGTFGDPKTTILAAQIGRTTYGDLDGDGKPEMITANTYELRVFTDFANGTWGDTYDLPVYGSVWYASVADLDADGRMDIVATSSKENAIVDDPIFVFRNTTQAPKACADGRDNDGDEKLDLGDPGCSSAVDDDETDPAPPPPPPPPAKQCEDGRDNDGDGTVDLADAGCSSAADDDESDDPPPPPPPPPALPFHGFFAPVNNLPTLNGVNAGRAVPVKFSLEGNRGLDVFAAGYPKSEEVPCAANVEVDGLEETLTAGSSSLSYDAAADRYQYVWKTSDAWAGTCRQLVVKLRDGSSHRANFKFR